MFFEIKKKNIITSIASSAMTSQGRGKGRNLMSYLQNCPCFVDDDEMTNRRHLGRLNSIFLMSLKL